MNMAGLPEAEQPVQLARKRQVHGAFGNSVTQPGAAPSDNRSNSSSKSSKHSLTQLPGEFLQVQLDT